MTTRDARRLRSLLAILAAGLIAAASATAAGAQPKPQPKPPSKSQPKPQQQPPPPPQQPNALQGFAMNRNQPVNIKSVSLDVRDRNKVATFSGNVQLVQGDTTMRCKTLVVHYDGDAAEPAVKSSIPGTAGNQQISRMEASGGVFVTQKDQTATGDHAIYDLKDNTVRLFPPAGGTVAVTQGPNVVRGQTLVVHLDTGISHFEGGVELTAIPQHAPATPGAPTKGR